NAVIRVVNHSKNEELLKFNLKDNYAGRTSLITADIYRQDGEWKFAAIGEGTNDTRLEDSISRYV
ncbi:TerD family protein, partial [Bacillus vallismortis]|nr:TerD family protein [Bacillus vallismortis]